MYADLCPSCAAYYGNRAAAYMMLSKYDRALDDARRSTQIDPAFVKVCNTVPHFCCEFVVALNLAHYVGTARTAISILTSRFAIYTLDPHCNFHAWCGLQCWRRGSMVRTLVFGCWTFPDLRLMYGWHVITLWVKFPLWVNQAGLLSLPSLWVCKWLM